MKNLFLCFTITALIFNFAFQASAEDLEAELFGGTGTEEQFFKTEELIVVSASKRAQKLSEAPVAISVITGEEIKQMGVQSIPDALRLIPGLYVQKITGGQYEVFIRGMGGMPSEAGPFSLYSRRILVLINGRSFFNDMFGGTLWEFLPITIDNIQRIEVVRGPSSALFGANAVTGVVNIITKKPILDKNNNSLYISGGSDNHNLSRVALNTAAKKWGIFLTADRSTKERFNYEEYDASKGKFVAGRGDRSDEASNSDFPAADDDALQVSRANITAYREYNENKKLTLEGGAARGYTNFMGHSGDLLISEERLENNYTKATYENLFGEVPVKLSLSWIGGKIGDKPKAGVNNGWGQGGIQWNTYDAEGQGILEWSDKDILVFGANWRQIEANSLLYFRNNKEEQQNFIGAFINNEHKINKELKLITAARVDHYTIPKDTQWSPQAILVYQPKDSNKMYRLNYSKAIRAPFITETKLDAPTQPTGFPTNLAIWTGNPDLKIPDIESIEFGIRTKLKEKTDLDINIFYEVYENAIAFDATNGDPWNTATPTPSLSLGFKNVKEKLRTSGAEIDLKMPLKNNWKSRIAYTIMDSKFGGKDFKGTPDKIAAINLAGFYKNWNINLLANYVSSIEADMTNIIDRNIDIISIDNDFSQVAAAASTAWVADGYQGMFGGVDWATALAGGAGATAAGIAQGIAVSEQVKATANKNIKKQINAYYTFNLKISKPFTLNNKLSEFFVIWNYHEKTREYVFGERFESVVYSGINILF